MKIGRAAIQDAIRAIQHELDDAAKHIDILPPSVIEHKLQKANDALSEVIDEIQEKGIL